MAVAARKWRQLAADANQAAEAATEMAHLKLIDAERALAEAQAAQEEAARLKDDIDHLLQSSEKEGIAHR
jgi:hypothetical protein